MARVTKVNLETQETSKITSTEIIDMLQQEGMRLSKINDVLRELMDTGNYLHSKYKFLFR